MIMIMNHLLLLILVFSLLSLERRAVLVLAVQMDDINWSVIGDVARSAASDRFEQTKRSPGKALYPLIEVSA